MLKSASDFKIEPSDFKTEPSDFEPSDFKIVTSANSNHNILIKESLLIAQTKPWLNNNV